MTLRTPRRRISPRTRKRYRAIKDFFKRAIGTSSQADLEINSSTSVNVIDLNHKIVGLEQQLSEISRTCREFKRLDSSIKESQNLFPTKLKDEMRSDNSPGRELHGVETKVLYKSSNHYSKSNESEYTPKNSKNIYYGTQNKMMNEYDTDNITKRVKNRNKVADRDKVPDINQNFRKHKTQSVYGSIVSACSTSNFHSLSELREVRHLNPGYSGDQPVMRLHKREQYKNHRRGETHNEQLKRFIPRDYEHHCEVRNGEQSKAKKSKHVTCELDQDFIADIIKRQYKPVKMFDRRNSNLSQFSEPLCRDREFTINMQDNIQEETEELCTCCYGSRNSPKQHRQSDSRSVCDARLYCSKRKPRFKYRRVRANAYDDTELYDLIPVKEKSSPKTRRKFAQDNLVNYHVYKEVPPSPRTHRPRLNLKSQYFTGSDEDIDFVRHGNRKVSPKIRSNYLEPVEILDTEHSSQIPYSRMYNQKLLCKQEQVHQVMDTMSGVQHPQHLNIEPNATVNTTLNKTPETISSADKTDRALYEIKDILQTFLQEIKNEAPSSGKSDDSTKMTKKSVNNAKPQVNASVVADSGHSYNYCVPQCNTAPTPYLSPYQNTCCYPVLPMYPMNCMQPSYAMPNQSFTCCCANKPDYTTENKVNNNETSTSETDNLIKEIYKLVVQSPTFPRKQSDNCIPDHQLSNFFENRGLTSRSTGGSTRVSKHDAKVGTPQMKYYSKSCEAIGSRMISDTNYSGTNAVYSDTALENLSQEATATASSDTETSTDRSDQSKKKNTTFGKVLRSFGLFKKKKNDAIEEVSESESTVDVEIRKKPPFRQEITNYMMRGQDYYQPPPVPQDNNHYKRQDNRYQCPHDYRTPYCPEMQYPEQATYPQAMSHHSGYHDPRMHHAAMYKQPPHNCHSEHPGYSRHPGYPGYPRHSTPPYASEMQPQVPLCLKEIEVKSMGTQSERKMSFFRKMKQKIQTPEPANGDTLRNFSTQTKQATPVFIKPTKPTFWQNLQTKAMEGKMEPMEYSYKQQKKLALGDTKMRNAMLKKMFYKRNPFSPRNLIVRTLLGKDKSSYGEPPAILRPRMFL